MFAKIVKVFFGNLIDCTKRHLHPNFDRFNMVAGLKEGNRVQGLALKLFGQAKAKKLFPRSWKNAIARGVVLRKGQGRKMVVAWDAIDTTSSVSTRLLILENASNEQQTPETAVSATAEASAASAVAPTADSSTSVQNDIGTESETEIPENTAYDSSEAACAINPGENLLKPHHCLWKKSDDVAVDVPNVAKMSPRIKWRDGLGNERSPLQYFMQFHPDHLSAGGTLTATNLSLHAAGCREMTKQEYFVYVDIIYVMSFYPKFKTRDLFSASSTMRRSNFLAVPDLSQYMAFSRYNDITNHLTFITAETHRVVGNTDAFWMVQPLIDSFNNCRRENFSPGAKLVVDESVFEWKGKDHRYGIDGCPHVTKIIRKPKGVGMEIKNMADCDSGVMVSMEVMAPKEEMKHRQYTARYGAGTALLLRLATNYRGTGRIVVADSAFASVKSACALKNTLGLYFLGLVKTAHRMFPKKYLQTVEIPERGGHVVLTTKVRGVGLRAVTWNDGKKDKKTGDIIRKNFVASCGVTLPGVGHRKRRWTVDDDGHAHLFFKTIPRPQLVEDYFEGAQKIDVHNHHRQGRAGIALERRPTKNWNTRFFRSFLGVVEVDSFLAYRHFCPGKGGVPHTEFLRVLTQTLLDNKIGCAPDAPVLRARTIDDPERCKVHSLKLLRNAKYYIAKTAAAAAIGKKSPQCVLKCRVCGRNSSMFCLPCTRDTSKCRMIHALCGPKTGRDCFDRHQSTVEAIDPM